MVQAKPEAAPLQHTAGEYDFFFGLDVAKHFARETFDAYDCTQAVTEAPGRATLLVRVGAEYSSFAHTQKPPVRS